MDDFELALLELLDHLGRRAAGLRVPAPRRGDLVQAWCAHGAAAEEALRAYLKALNADVPAGELAQRAISFEALLREVLRGRYGFGKKPTFS